ncbi:MAG: hypothetical protein GX941_02890 [Candidatus Methanofastidiosa archaeon]|jgi:hypothetical protein|nr:hypothetical protein [Candidatus Methanofastidiosa archaeon]HPC81535.1 hypothetical protein [Methanofastidiosum sp.]HRS25750.1 hypothetical protein [Methanofastidiosum sp.]
MIKRIIGLSIMGLSLIMGSYFSIYFSLIGNQMMLLTLSGVTIVLFIFGLLILLLDRKERKLKKEKKIILEMIKKARVAQERQIYPKPPDDLMRGKIY